MRKPVFRISDQIPSKPGCTSTEDGWRLEILYLGRREIVIAKTKALISFAVTAKLICIFVFAYEKSQFSHDAAHFAFFFMKTMLWVLKESPRGPRGSNSNEHPQQKFLWRNVKNDLSVIIYAPLICSSTLVVFLSLYSC